MKKFILALVGIAVVAGAIVAIVAANNNKSGNSNQSSGASSQNMANTSKSSSSSGQTPTATDKVSIANFAFSPSSITVKKGTTVTWTNNDSAPHQPTADSGTGPSSQPLNNGQTYSFTYNTVGTFPYHCAIHTEMHGTVIVTE